VPPKTEPEVGEMPVIVEDVFKLIPVVSIRPYLDTDEEVTAKV
jgi:hypothetical protein